MPAIEEYGVGIYLYTHTISYSYTYIQRLYTIITSVVPSSMSMKTVITIVNIGLIIIIKITKIERLWLPVIHTSIIPRDEYSAEIMLSN